MVNPGCLVALIGNAPALHILYFPTFSVLNLKVIYLSLKIQFHFEKGKTESNIGQIRLSCTPGCSIQCDLQLPEQPTLPLCNMQNTKTSLR